MRERFDKRQNITNRNYTLAPEHHWRSTRDESGLERFIQPRGDVADTRRDRNTNFDLQYSYQFAREKDRFRKVSGHSP